MWYLSCPRSLLTGLTQGLIKENHQHLYNLGVSHPSLEEIKEITADFGLSTKLTGAGGGGCAVTLVPDGKLVLDNRNSANWF